MSLKSANSFLARNIGAKTVLNFGGRGSRNFVFVALDGLMDLNVELKHTRAESEAVNS